MTEEMLLSIILILVIFIMIISVMDPFSWSSLYKKFKEDYDELNRRLISAEFNIMTILDNQDIWNKLNNKINNETKIEQKLDKILEILEKDNKYWIMETICKSNK